MNYWQLRALPWLWPSGLPGPPGCCLSDRTLSAVGWQMRWQGRRLAGWGPGRRKGSQRTSQASSVSLKKFRWRKKKCQYQYWLLMLQILSSAPWSLCFDTILYRAERTSWWDITVHIPGESVSELLSLNLHVQTDWNQDFRLSGVLMDHCWIVVIEAGRDEHTGPKVTDSSWNDTLHSLNASQHHYQLYFITLIVSKSKEFVNHQRFQFIKGHNDSTE